MQHKFFPCCAMGNLFKMLVDKMVDVCSACLAEAHNPAQQYASVMHSHARQARQLDPKLCCKVLYALPYPVNP